MRPTGREDRQPALSHFAPVDQCDVARLRAGGLVGGVLFRCLNMLARALHFKPPNLSFSALSEGIDPCTQLALLLIILSV